MSLIRIEHLYFTYDGGSEPVFEDLDLQLDTDWKLGLVGRNGRGKTTLLRLLEGGLEYRGQIRTGGLACRPVPLRRPGDGGPGVPGAAGYLTGGRGVAAGPGAVPAGAG